MTGSIKGGERDATSPFDSARDHAPIPMMSPRNTLYLLDSHRKPLPRSSARNPVDRSCAYDQCVTLGERAVTPLGTVLVSRSTRTTPPGTETARQSDSTPLASLCGVPPSPPRTQGATASTVPDQRQ